jgi:hypothetical protein
VSSTSVRKVGAIRPEGVERRPRRELAKTGSSERQPSVEGSSNALESLAVGFWIGDMRSWVGA